MQKYKIVIAYDGTDYFGWQKQKEVPSVTDTLEDRFYSVFNRRISLLGASRTDAGVHANHQVACFSCDLTIEPEAMMYAWSNILPPDIVIKDLQPVHDQFNPCHNVKIKTYHYHFFLERPLPDVQRYGWYFRHPVDLKKLETVMQEFVGTHDFRSFCTGDEREDTVRTIESISVEFCRKFGAHRIVVRGQKFLHHMVRRIVGAGLEVASRQYLSSVDLIEAIAKKDPEQILPKAPAKGLVLHSIIYESEK